MANLTKGTTISIDTLVTSQTLHNLIENALLSNIGPSDLIAGTHFISVGTATPNPSAYPFWFSNDPEDPIVRVFALPWGIWCAIGPDRYELPLRNNSGVVVPKGALVVADSSSSFNIATSPSLNALGFLQATTVTGAYGPVAVCGIGWTLHTSSPSLGGAGQAPTPASGLKAFGCLAGGVAGLGIGGNGGSGPLFGMWLEGNRSGASGHGSAFRASIWGPKLTVGPA